MSTNCGHCTRGNIRLRHLVLGACRVSSYHRYMMNPINAQTLCSKTQGNNFQQGLCINFAVQSSPLLITAFCHQNFVKSGPQLWTHFFRFTIVDFLPKGLFFHSGVVILGEKRSGPQDSQRIIARWFRTMGLTMTAQSKERERGRATFQWKEEE